MTDKTNKMILNVAETYHEYLIHEKLRIDSIVRTMIKICEACIFVLSSTLRCDY